MSPIDNTLRASKILVDSAKDACISNVIAAVRGKSLSLSDEDLSKMITLITHSSDDGYQRALTTFQKTISPFFSRSNEEKPPAENSKKSIKK